MPRIRDDPPLTRGLAAFALSFLFTLGYGQVAARVRLAERVLLPLLRHP